MCAMHLRELNVGCVGGGTGLPSLLGGLKANPWLRVNAVVTMFDSGGSSGQLRDQLGVLPPGDVLKCALALSRNEREARNVLLARVPALDPRDRLGGHTGGNLLLSMMERYSGDFLSAVDSLRALLGCKGRVWPVTVELASVCAEYADGTRTRGEVEVDAGQSRGHEVRRLWLEPQVSIHPEVAGAIRSFDAVIIGPGSFFTSLLPPLLVLGVKEALAEVRGPIILITNLLTEGRGMEGFTAAEAVRWVERAIGRRVDVVIANTRRPSADVLKNYAAEHKAPLELGDLDAERRDGARAVLEERHRAPRPSSSCVRRVVRPQPAAARGQFAFSSRAGLMRSARRVGIHVASAATITTTSTGSTNAGQGGSYSEPAPPAARTSLDSPNVRAMPHVDPIRTRRRLCAMTSPI